MGTCEKKKHLLKQVPFAPQERQGLVVEADRDGSFARLSAGVRAWGLPTNLVASISVEFPATQIQHVSLPSQAIPQEHLR